MHVRGINHTLGLSIVSRKITASDLLPLENSFGYQIRATHRLFQRYLQSKIEPYGVTIGMWYFLRVLWNGDGLTQRELSLRIGTMEPTTLAALRSMERNGFIRRERNADDRRRINVFLTDLGRSLEADLLPLAKKVVEDSVRGISNQDQEELLQILSTMQRNISEKIEN